MKISTRGRYALRVMIDLAEHSGESFIPLKDIVGKADAPKNVLDEYLRDPNKPLDVVKIKSEIYPGNTDTATAIAGLNDPKKEAEQIRNYVLFGNITPDPKIASWTGAMTPEAWKDMCDDLSSSARLVQEASKAMVKSLESGMKALESIRKKEEAEANKPKPTQEADQPQQQQGTNTEQLFKLFQQIAQTYQINVINAITNTFFNTYYGAYRDIVAAFQSQSKNAATSNVTDKANAAAASTQAANATANAQQTATPTQQQGGGNNGQLV